MALSHFGLEVRRLRLDLGIKLKDMADKLGVTSAFLSAVETGSKPVPPSLPEDIAREYRLDNEAITRLRKAALKSVRSVRLEVSDRTDRAQELAVTFARRFPSMDETEVERLMKALVENKTHHKTGDPKKK